MIYNNLLRGLGLRGQGGVKDLRLEDSLLLIALCAISESHALKPKP